MRFRSLAILVVVLAFLAWTGYSIVAASSVYLQVGSVVDRAVTEALQRRKAQQASGTSQDYSNLIGALGATISDAARRQGIALDPEGPSVTEVGNSVRVSVGWSFPLRLYDDWLLVYVPMSLTRVYTTGI